MTFIIEVASNLLKKNHPLTYKTSEIVHNITPKP